MASKLSSSIAKVLHDHNKRIYRIRGNSSFTNDPRLRHFSDEYREFAEWDADDVVREDTHLVDSKDE
jgi:hypothetical protein